VNVHRDAKLHEIASVLFPVGVSYRSLLRLGAFDRIDLEHGRTIAREDDAVNCVFVVLSGALEAATPGRHRTLRAGAIVGDAPTLARQPWPHRLEVVGSARLLVIPARQFSSLMTEVPEFGAVVLRSLSIRVVEAEQLGSHHRRRNHHVAPA
jgi:CRP-like cAMP-binding protein